MSWRTEGRLNVVVQGVHSPTNLEWQRYVTMAVATSARNDTRVVILSRGGSPDGAQRQALVKAMRGRPDPVALLTDKVLARAAVAALRPFNPTMRAFPTTGLKEACEFLSLTPDERERVAKLLVELEKELDEATVAEPPGRPGSR